MAKKLSIRALSKQWFTPLRLCWTFISNSACRKNCILAGLAYISYESVVSGLAHLEDIALDLYRPPVTVLIYEPESITCSYFFRLVARKPRASLRISLTRLVSRSSCSNSRMRRSFSERGTALWPLPTKASSP